MRIASSSLRLFVLAFLALMLVGMPRVLRAETRARRAEDLFASAQRRLAVGGHEERQFALSELKDAATLAPERVDIAVALGELYLDSDLLHCARDVAARLIRDDSTNDSVWRLDGVAWRRTWLVTSDREARDRAIVSLARSARLAPTDPRAWKLLAPLLADADEIEMARDVAAHAVRSAPGDPEAQVMLASLAQRSGDLATADRVFRTAIPRLPARLRDRFEDVAPLLPPAEAERYTLENAAGRHAYAARFWAETDPDPVTPENEALLEYWARVAQASALYGTTGPGEWDMRAQFYVRFGPPEFEEVNPLDTPQNMRQCNWLAWSYPEIGVRVWMGTTSFLSGFPLPISDQLLSAHAYRDSLQRHAEWVGVHDGWAVLHRLPPGVEPLDVRLALAGFQSASGTNFLAHAEAAGDAQDGLTAEWVVLDSTRQAVTRQRDSMAPSACRADQGRAASFTANVPAGHYEIAAQITNARGQRGIVRREVLASPVTDRLALSDLVVTCSTPEQSIVSSSAVRLEPETGLFPPAGDQLNAYFEIYHLAPRDDGEARFVYDCTVRPIARDSRGWLSRVIARRETSPPYRVSRTETTHGSLRRQFLRLPLGGLAGGRYEVAIVVRDLESGQIATTTTAFDWRDE